MSHVAEQSARDKALAQARWDLSYLVQDSWTLIMDWNLCGCLAAIKDCRKPDSWPRIPKSLLVIGICDGMNCQPSVESPSVSAAAPLRALIFPAKCTRSPGHHSCFRLEPFSSTLSRHRLVQIMA